METSLQNRINVKKQRRQKRKKYAFYSVLMTFFVVLIAVVSLTVFFNVGEVIVTGNEYYSKAEIIEVSGLREGQNMFRLNKFKIIDNMCEKMPYLNNVSIDRHLPVKIEIIVEECKPYFYSEVEGKYYLLDENLKVLENVEQKPEKLPTVTGLENVAFEINKVITDENGVCSRLSMLCNALKENLGDDCVTGIDVSTSYEMKFTYQDRIEVIVGTAEKIDYKLELVKHVIQDNLSNEIATIDASSGTLAFYRSVEQETEPEPEMETQNDSQDETENSSEKEND